MSNNLKDGKPIVTDLADSTTKVPAKRDTNENETNSPGRTLERPKITRPRVCKKGVSGEAQSEK